MKCCFTLQIFRPHRQTFAARKLAKTGGRPTQGSGDRGGGGGGGGAETVSALPSTYSVHEFHNYGYQSTGISPGLHFHLAGTINALTDIPLVPAMAAGDRGNQR